MPSERKTQSARANGAKSRGPKTAEGRATSAMNAVTHGLTARNLVLEVESEEQFQKLRESYLLELDPRTQIEADLVDQMVAARWRLERLSSIETALLDLKIFEQREEFDKKFENIDEDTRLALAFRALCDNSGSLALLNRYEARLHRTFERALESLRTLRAAQKMQNEPNPTNEHSHIPEPRLDAHPEAHPAPQPKPLEPQPLGPQPASCSPRSAFPPPRAGAGRTAPFLLLRRSRPGL